MENLRGKDTLYEKNLSLQGCQSNLKGGRAYRDRLHFEGGATQPAAEAPRPGAGPPFLLETTAC